jgi:hypothetical protein
LRLLVVVVLLLLVRLCSGKDAGCGVELARALSTLRALLLAKHAPRGGARPAL